MMLSREKMAGKQRSFPKGDQHGAIRLPGTSQWIKAAVAYQQALEEFQTTPRALTSLGWHCLSCSATMIRSGYQKAVQAAPSDPLPPEKVGQLLERLGNNKAAVQACPARVRNFTLKPGYRQGPRKIGGASPRSILKILLHVCTWQWSMNVLVHAPQATSEYLVVASIYQALRQCCQSR